MSISLVGEGERADLRSIGSADGDEIVRDRRPGERSGLGDGADIGASSACRFVSKRRAEGGGVFAGDDFWGEIDLARSMHNIHSQPLIATAARVTRRKINKLSGK